MTVKECCVLNCFSSSTRNEDLGVTFHKFPKNPPLFDYWVSKTHHTPVASKISYVCSRHFCKSDFRLFMDSKYVLKSDAVPSIYPWTIMDKDDLNTETEEVTDKQTIQENAKIIENVTTDVVSNDAPTDVNSEPTENFHQNNIIETDKITEETNTTQDGENINDIKDFLDNHSNNDISTFNNEQIPDNVQKLSDKELSCVLKVPKEAATVASNVMEMIYTKNNKSTNNAARPTFTSPDKATSNNALTVGTKVEAKDYDETWYPAMIAEVDFDEMEVLVHYDQPLKKPDEWISVSSSRLKPFGVKTSVSTTAPLTPVVSIARMPPTLVASTTAEEGKEERPKLVFVEGERCLARWRDNRRFIATIKTDLGDGHFEIMFDDGFIWKCTATRLSKLKESQIKTEPEEVAPLATTPVSNSPTSSTTPQPPFHTHLFDPSRDYLGSKSERRALKRKLNIKEIFNIGQKKMKKEYIPRERTPKVTPIRKPAVEKKPKAVKKTPVKSEIKIEVKAEIPDAVASIIGTVVKDEAVPIPVEYPVKQEQPDTVSEEELDAITPKGEIEAEIASADDTSDNKKVSEVLEKISATEPVEEEQMLENFDLPDEKKHEEVIDKIKEAINKLEDGLNVERAPSPEPESKPLKIEPEGVEKSDCADKEKIKKMTKIKKGKKLRLLQEKRVKKQVERVRSELEEMKRQVEAMRLEMLVKTEELDKARAEQLAKVTEGQVTSPPAGEWACRWVNGQPAGAVSEMPAEPRHNNKPALPRRSVQVEDNRLPEGWTKHMVRRSFGSSAGKWDVVLISGQNERFHTRVEMRNYLDRHPELIEYEKALLDFGIHLKLARRLGWVTETPDGATEGPIPIGTLANTSPLVKKKSLSLKKKMKRSKMKQYYNEAIRSGSGEITANHPPLVKEEIPPMIAEEGYVFVGSLKVQIIENLLRCPAEGCFKNFRNNTLLKMHIKHYHRELRKMLGATPKVVDLAYERRPELIDTTPLRKESRTIKVKLPKPKVKKPPVLFETPKVEPTDLKYEETTAASEFQPEIASNQDSPKLRSVLASRPVKRPKVLLPVRRPLESTSADETSDDKSAIPRQPVLELSKCDHALDFETAISTHTVTKPALEKMKKFSEDEDGWYGASSDVDTQSSFPRSLSPDAKFLDHRMIPPMSSESNDDQKEPNMYMYDEFGRRIKIVHMKREEIINCHCGFREEDGLMVQCELCLCWQHAICHNIHREADVPDKYTCSICVRPRRGRASRRWLHAQERLFAGALPAGRACASLRRSHELSGNLLRLQDALHAASLKYATATKKNHRKLYLWAKDWETTEISMTQEKLNSDYSDLNIMISDIGKENLPIKAEDNLALELRSPPADEPDGDKYTHRESLSQTLLNGLLSSPGGASLDLPISTLELERLAKAVVEQELQQSAGPQPEPAIEDGACRERLLRHLQRCHHLVDARLDSIEAQVAELESQDPSFEDDETADYFPRTKQTIQMLMRDLDVMEELGVHT